MTDPTMPPSEPDAYEPWWQERTASLPPLMRLVVEAIAPAWVATQAELEDEARLVMGAFATWLDGAAAQLRPTDLAYEVRAQRDDSAAPQPADNAHTDGAS